MLREALTLDRLNAMTPDEAAAWFVAQRDEGLNPHEEELLAQWLGADRAHAAAYRSAGEACDVFAGAEDDEILSAMRAHALAAPPARRIGWPRLAAAAAVVLVVAAGLLLQLRPGQGPVETMRYAAAQGEIRTVTLPDGSTMTLDAQSVAVSSFGNGERSVELERGRALFDVKRDPERPFAVSAGDRRVVVLGTQFEVDRGAKRLAVTLFKGRVAVEKDGAATVSLVPGEQFVEAGGIATKRKAEATGAAPSAWRNGLLDFDDRTLADAAAEVNRYARDPIVIRDPAVAAMRISGQFRAGDAERFARTVAEVHPLRVVVREGEIELLPKR